MIPKTSFFDDSILVRPFERVDALALYGAVRESMNELKPWMSWCHDNYVLSDASDWVESRDYAWATGEEYTFAIVQRQSGTFAGTVGLNQINRVHSFGNLGFWIRSSLAKQGMATAATQMAARFALHQLGLERVEILAMIPNVASRRVAEKSGARPEGILRKRLIVHEKAHDAAMYSLVAEDFN
jgi:ribosomal-protein-serine acetyltransferase